MEVRVSFLEGVLRRLRLLLVMLQLLLVMLQLIHVVLLVSPYL